VLNDGRKSPTNTRQEDFEVPIAINNSTIALRMMWAAERMVMIMGIIGCGPSSALTTPSARMGAPPSPDRPRRDDKGSTARGTASTPGISTRSSRRPSVAWTTGTRPISAALTRSTQACVNLVQVGAALRFVDMPENGSIPGRFSESVRQDCRTLSTISEARAGPQCLRGPRKDEPLRLSCLPFA
jgi:hypothetical protein